MSNQITKLSFYLEIKASDKLGLESRLNRIARDLHNIKIKDHGVFTLSNEKDHFEPIENIIEIPHFNHNYNCDGNCKNNKINKVYRIFTNSSLLVEGKPEKIMGIYKLNDYEHIIFCGIQVQTITPGTDQVEKIKSFYK